MYCWQQEDEPEPTAKKQRMEVGDAASDDENNEEKTEKEAMVFSSKFLFKSVLKDYAI